MATNRVKRLPWFRLYTEIVNDPKVARLNDKQFRFWINILCLSRQNAGLLRYESFAGYAWSLRIKESAFSKGLQELMDAGLVDMTGDGEYTPHGWAGRQFESDNSTERVKRHRKQVGNVSETLSATPPEEEADTEHIQITEAEGKTTTSAPHGNGSFIMQANWQPSPESRGRIAARFPALDLDYALREFRHYWTTERASKTKLQTGWELAFEGDAERKNKHVPPPAPQEPTRRALKEIRE